MENLLNRPPEELVMKKKTNKLSYGNIKNLPSSKDTIKMERQATQRKKIFAQDLDKTVYKQLLGNNYKKTTNLVENLRT